MDMLTWQLFVYTNIPKINKLIKENMGKFTRKSVKLHVLPVLHCLGGDAF